MPEIPSLFAQLMKAAAAAADAQEAAKRPAWPANPFERGLRAGSTTDAVLRELRRVAPATLNHGQLRIRCNAGRGAINWATAYLEASSLIEALSDPRSPLYRRYRAKPQRNE